MTVAKKRAPSGGRAMPSALCAACALLVSAGARAGDHDPHAKGVRPPSAAASAWMGRHAVKVAEVHPNWLGLRRLNEVRRVKGLPPLDASVARAPGQVIVPGGGPGATKKDGGARLTSWVKSLSKVDNSAEAWFPPIISQGQLSSCSAVSTTYYQMTHMTGLARSVGGPLWDAKNGGAACWFSPKWSYNMINDGFDAGAHPIDAYSLLAAHGGATWQAFPYDGTRSPETNYTGWCLDPAVWRDAIGYRTDQVGSVGELSSPAGLDNLKELLADGYVLVMLTYISDFNDERGWRYTQISGGAQDGKDICFWVEDTDHQGGHAMTIVGYDDTIWVDIDGDGQPHDAEKGALRIANSWGPGWDPDEGTPDTDGGFTWLAYDALRPVSEVPGWSPPGLRIPALSIDEAYWITARASYAPKLLGEFTVSHACRWDMLVSLGRSSTGQTAPQVRWGEGPWALQEQGGPLSLDGSAGGSEAAGTFVFDFTDLAMTEGSWRYHLIVADIDAQHDPNPYGTTVSAFKLVVPHSGAEYPASASLLPAVVEDNGDATPDEIYVYADCVYNRPPQVTLSAPALVQLGADVTLTADATDPDAGDHVTKVEFLAGTTLVGEDVDGGNGWGVVWTSPGAATYYLIARATDMVGKTATSTGVSVKVNAPPTVSISEPPDGSERVTSGVTIAAAVADADSGIAKVEFFHGGTNKIGEKTSAPWRILWGSPAETSYTLTATVTDNDLATATSAPVTITVALDTDGDGMSDTFELTATGGSSTTALDPTEDPDEDRVTNLDEYLNGTDPSVSADNDGDAMPDDWEIAHGLDPTIDDSWQDADLDTFSNLAEYEAGTDPRDQRSHPPTGGGGGGVSCVHGDDAGTAALLGACALALLRLRRRRRALFFACEPPRRQ